MIDIRIVEIINRSSMDFSHNVDRYSHNSLFLSLVELRMYNAVTTTAAAVVILSYSMFSDSFLII